MDQATDSLHSHQNPQNLIYSEASIFWQGYFHTIDIGTEYSSTASGASIVWFSRGLFMQFSLDLFVCWELLKTPVHFF